MIWSLSRATAAVSTLRSSRRMIKSPASYLIASSTLQLDAGPEVMTRMATHDFHVTVVTRRRHGSSPGFGMLLLLKRMGSNGFGERTNGGGRAGLKVSQNISLVKCGCSFVFNIIFALYQLASMASSSERNFYIALQRQRV